MTGSDDSGAFAGYAHSLRSPGGTVLSRLRELFTRLSGNLEEAENLLHATDKGKFLHTLETVAVDAENCFPCAARTCIRSCPDGKEIPQTLALIREVGTEGFKILTEEFGGIMEKCDIHLKQYLFNTEEEYLKNVREKHMEYLNALIAEAVGRKPEFGHALGKLERAFDKQVAISVFAEFTGLLCPAPCEGGCTLHANGAEAAKIKHPEFDLAAIGYALGWLDKKFKVPDSVERTEKHAMVVGAGPAGLEAAYKLAMAGHKVTIYERDSEIGGLIHSGIPDHKFDKERLIKYRVFLEQMGVEFKFNHEVTKEEILQHTQSGQPVFVASGVMDTPREPEVECYAEVKARGKAKQAYQYLRERNEAVAAGADEPDPTTKRRLILGAGLTAVDVMRCSLREGKTTPESCCAIYCVQSDRQPPPPKDKEAAGSGWPGKAEIDEDWSPLKDEMRAGHASILHGSVPSKFNVNDDGSVTVTFKFQKAKTSKVAKEFRREFEQDNEVGDIRDANGKAIGVRRRDDNGNTQDYAMLDNGRIAQNPSPAGTLKGEVDGTSTMVFDEVIPAYGSKGPYESKLFKELGIVSVENNRSNIEGVYVLGDAATSPDKWIIVAAQRNAKLAAAAFESDCRAPGRAWKKSCKIEPVLLITPEARAAEESMSFREETAQSL